MESALTRHDHCGDVDGAGIIERQFKSEFVIVIALAYASQTDNSGIQAQFLQIRDISAARHAGLEKEVVSDDQNQN
jgi:hypothetical protein